MKINKSVLLLLIGIIILVFSVAQSHAQSLDSHRLKRIDKRTHSLYGVKTRKYRHFKRIKQCIYYAKKRKS